MATNAVPGSVLAPEKVNVICYFLLQIARSGNVCGLVLIPFDCPFVSHHVPSNTNTKLISSRGCHNNLTLITLSKLFSRRHFEIVFFLFFFFFFFFWALKSRTVYLNVHPAILTSRKRAYIILTPLNPTFYIVKLEFTGVYIIFLISAQKLILWVLVRTASPRRF